MHKISFRLQEFLVRFNRCGLIRMGISQVIMDPYVRGSIYIWAEPSFVTDPRSLRSNERSS